MKNYLDEKVKKNAYDVILRLNYKAQLFLLAVYDLKSNDSGDNFVVMEYVAGDSLQALLRRAGRNHAPI